MPAMANENGWTTYEYIGDKAFGIINDVARRITAGDLDTAVEELETQFLALGAPRATEDRAWCRYALEASCRGEPLAIVV